MPEPTCPLDAAAYRAGVIRDLAQTFEARGERLHVTGWPWHASRQMTAAEVLREELARGEGP